MTKREFKNQLEELLWHYFHSNRHKKDLPDIIDFQYTREEPNKESYGELCFTSEKRDVLLKIKPIDYKE